MRVLNNYSLKFINKSKFYDNISLKSSLNPIESFNSINPLNSLNSFNSFELTNIINAWSVNGSTLSSSDTASNLFTLSLIPYLVFLFLLSRPITKTPKLALFGFQFLLVFVFATIPAGIIAKSQYNDILANVDYLHGAAESLLTVTNLLIINGFLNNNNKSNDNKQPVSVLNDFSILLLSGITLLSNGLLTSDLLSFPHVEPSNALSIPTWIVHTSSVLEWYIAMTLVWKQADISNNPRWKDLTWGMLPAHASGICACTFHFFYNSASVYWLVGLQALLTVIGNTTLALGAYRIFNYESNNINNAVSSVETTVTQSSTPNNYSSFWINNIIKVVLSAVVIKYGELWLDFPFNPDGEIAGSIVIGATLLVAGLFYYREKNETI